MNQYHQQITQQTWNKVAQLYEQKFMHTDWYNESYDALCELLIQPSPSILDVGCGPANISAYISNKIPSATITGIDYAEEMIKLAAKNIPSGNFIRMDIRNIDKINTSFNAIIAGFCIPYLSPDECKNFVSASASLLHHDGLFYLSFVEGDPELSGLITGSTGDSTYFHYYQTEDVIKLLKANTFQIIHQFTIPYNKYDGSAENHIALICRK